MARRSIWTRAKHRVGLERPHSCTRFRAQSDAWGRSSLRRDSFRCFARVRRRILDETFGRKKVNKVKTVRTTLCTFRAATSSPNARPTEFILKRFPTTTSAKVTAQKRSNRAGATPLFCGRAAQKFRGVAPALVPFAPPCIARSRGAIPRICQTICLTFCKSKKGEARCPF